MAAEIFSVSMAKPGFCTIGKAVDHEVELLRAIGVNLLRRYRNPMIISAIEAHHGDVEPQR